MSEENVEGCANRSFGYAFRSGPLTEAGSYQRTFAPRRALLVQIPKGTF
jgi:hypothetical protein